MQNTLTSQLVPLRNISIANTRRPASRERVQALAKSISDIGLLHPVGITTNSMLVYGWHRIEAYRELGWTEIPAVTVELDDLRVELAEIDENLQRSSLTALQEANVLKRRKEIYEALHPETKQGAQGGRGSGEGAWVEERQDDVLSFAEDTASQTGKSRRTVERAVEVAEKIPEDVQEAIAETAVADNKSALSKLAKLDESEQREEVERIRTGESTLVGRGTSAASATAAEIAKAITTHVLKWCKNQTQKERNTLASALSSLADKLWQIED